MSKETKVAINVGNTVFYTLPESQAPRNPSRASLLAVRQDYGAEIAAAIARRMVVPPHRDGGQAQYIETPLLSAPDKGEPFGATLAWIAAHLHEDLTVEQMAARAVMSPRTFARHFRATLGTTPYQWLLQQRIVLAQRLLETTNETIERVATCCGFSSAATLRLHFQRLLHTSPQVYRHAFHRENSGFIQHVLSH
jgi:transcriptional regulator GlxA family with amidase domain